jgi:hypothetical protein
MKRVNTLQLYYTGWCTPFTIHTEGVDLYSINYNHFVDYPLLVGYPMTNKYKTHKLPPECSLQVFQAISK